MLVCVAAQRRELDAFIRCDTVRLFSTEVQVRFKIYLLRHRGRRLPWRDVKNGKTYVGTLTTRVLEHNGERYSALEVLPADPMSPDHPPPLYEPVLLGFAPLAFRLRGARGRARRRLQCLARVACRGTATAP